MRAWPLTLALIAGLQAAAPAHAATLSITPDKAIYQVGEEIVLNVFGDPEGAPEGRIVGRILFDEALASYLSSSQDPLTELGGRASWFVDPLTNGAGFADAFRQALVNPGVADGPLSATVTLLATAPGALTYSWFTAPGFEPFSLRFFGIFDAPGGSVLIVPEPATGALLALGLLGLAMRSEAR